MSPLWVFLITLPLGIPIGLLYALPLTMFAERMPWPEHWKVGALIATGMIVAIAAVILATSNTEALWIAIKFGPVYLLICYAVAFRTQTDPS